MILSHHISREGTKTLTPED